MQPYLKDFPSGFTHSFNEYQAKLYEIHNPNRLSNPYISQWILKKSMRHDMDTLTFQFLLGV